MNLLKHTAVAVSVVGVFSLSSGTSAQVRFFTDGAPGDSNFSNAGNWPGGVPTDFDLAVHNNPTINAIEITSDHNVDSFRISNGGGVTHTGGILTLRDTDGAGNPDNDNDLAPDVGLWIGEFGPATSTYTLDGGTLVSEEGFDALQVGRGLEATGVFNFLSGTINMLDDASPEFDQDVNGRTVIGLDGNATWNQSGGTFNGGLVQVGLFQSPTADVNLSGDAQFFAPDGLTISESAKITPEVDANSGPSTFQIQGTGVTVEAGELKLLDKAILSFVADQAGVSPLTVTGSVIEFGLDGGSPDLTVDFSAFADTASDVTLIDANSALTLGSSGFDGLAEGTVVPNSRGRTITYSGGSDGFDVVLLAVSLGIVGDYNNSGSVEQGDLNLVLNNWGQPTPFMPNGDPFDTPLVDQEEINRVLNNWGATNAPAFNGSPVPEPGALALLNAACLAGIRRHRRAF